MFGIILSPQELRILMASRFHDLWENCRDNKPYLEDLSKRIGYPVFKVQNNFAIKKDNTLLKYSDCFVKNIIEI